MNYESSNQINSNVNNVYSVNKNKNRFRNRKWKKNELKSSSKVSILSCNAASIRNKLLSLEKIVNDLHLSMFCLQETHEVKMGSIKFVGSENFQIYEKIRINKGGGGLAVGILKEFNPTWMRDGGDEVEALTVKFHVKNINVRLVNAYAPQEYDSLDKKMHFWKYFDDEVLNSKNEGSGLIYLFDGNAWLGPSVIKADPHKQNKNGEMLNSFLVRNSNLTLLNASDLCEGVITRSRKAGEKMNSL